MPAKLENLAFRLVEHNPKAQHSVGRFFDRISQKHQPESDVGHAPIHSHGIIRKKPFSLDTVNVTSNTNGKATRG
jgi:hypothetical protein